MLSIDNVTTQNEGLYKAVFTNEFGSSETKSNVTVLGKC